MTSHLSYESTLGRQPDILPNNLRHFNEQANQGDINAVFELSRVFYDQEGGIEDLDAALFYKSILVENFPEERDPYTCAVTHLEIALIFAEKLNMEASKVWFRKTYVYINENYMPKYSLCLMAEIGFFEAVVESGFLLSEIIKRG